MKVSERWLREHVNPSENTQQLAEKLTMAGLEVDAITAVAGSFNGVVVAEVLETRAHPQADRLTLCTVQAKENIKLSVVCGAHNVRPGLKVALAEVGAQLPGNLVIKEAKLRGELSQGMLCSASELGLSEHSEGILELEKDAPIGVDLRTYLHLNDLVLDIDLTPNRADCLSIRGIAREVAALTHSPLKDSVVPQVSCQGHEEKSITVSAKKACPRYCGRVISGIKTDITTPVWLKEKLRRSGLRPIHPIVDITNYVMLEWGQPLHAFDLKAISGAIEVRYAKNEEACTLLNGQKLSLCSEDLVIADTHGVLALAGVMGGASSAVHEGTTAIFLESAYFSPNTIAATARRYGHISDASQRFERGVDYALPTIALDYATALFTELTGAVAGPMSLQQDEAYLPKASPIVFRPKKLYQLIGIELSVEEMIAYLAALHISLVPEGDVYHAKVPSYRFDLQNEMDLIEEIVRLYGYDKIPMAPMTGSLLTNKPNRTEDLSQYCADFFASKGYHETISYSFVDPNIQNLLYPNQEELSLLNPISSELSSMRLGMWPGLIASMMYNIHRQQTAIKLFEIGVIFENQSNKIQEYPCFAALLTGESGTLNWAERKRPYDFYDLKGDLEALFGALKVPTLRFVPAAHPALHPGKSAQICLGGKILGWCGILHPRLNFALDMQQEVGVCELRLDLLDVDVKPIYRGISRFPQIRRDLSLLVDESVRIEQIYQLVTEAAPKDWLKSLDVFDLYRGDSIPKGKKSLAIALTLQDNERTLIDVEINTLIDAILKALDEALAITLRDIS